MRPEITNLLNRILTASVQDVGRTEPSDHDSETGQWAEKDKTNITFSNECCPVVEYDEPEQKEFWEHYVNAMNKIGKSGTISDETLGSLYKNLGKHIKTDYFRTAEGLGAHITRSLYTCGVTNIEVTDIVKYPNTIGCVVHELGHCMDMDKKFITFSERKFREIQNELTVEKSDIPKEWLEEASQKTQSYESQIDKLDKEYRRKMEEPNRNMGMLCSEKWGKVCQCTNDFLADTDGINAISDICDALTNGALYTDGVTALGHGKSYYEIEGNKCYEIWANYCVLAMMFPKRLQELKQHFPKIVETCEAISKEIAKEWEQKENS